MFLNFGSTREKFEFVWISVHFVMCVLVFVYCYYFWWRRYELDCSHYRCNWILHRRHSPRDKSIKNLPKAMARKKTLLPSMELPDKKILQFHPCLSVRVTNRWHAQTLWHWFICVMVCNIILNVVFLYLVLGFERNADCFV